MHNIVYIYMEKKNTCVCSKLHCEPGIVVYVYIYVSLNARLYTFVIVYRDLRQIYTCIRTTRACMNAHVYVFVIVYRDVGHTYTCMYECAHVYMLVPMYRDMFVSCACGACSNPRCITLHKTHTACKQKYGQ